MRSLMGRLNQFVLAPGSLTDISVWAHTYIIKSKISAMES
jgi:hypothetical protein